MIKTHQYILRITLALACAIFVTRTTFGQAELQPWGNMNGIRIDGHLVEFESNISVVQKNWTDIKATGKEKQRPRYSRKGNQQIVTTNIDSLDFTETVEDAGKGGANINVQLTSKADVPLEGVFFALSLPGNSSAESSKAPVKTAQFGTKQNGFTLTFAEPTSFIVRKHNDKGKQVQQVFIPIQTGDLKKGQQISKAFSIKAEGIIDKNSITLTLNTTIQGRAFDGLGGNFRLQFPDTDPQVIDYSLANLRVACGRVEMPWRFWQPSIDSNPTMEAKAGRMRPEVLRAMEMAQRLYKIGMPVIVSAWSAPAWAIVGTRRFRPGADGVWGNPLDQSKTNEIYKSITDYIVYLKAQYGVEVSMFSFNESDLGINVRQTGAEHAKLIKELGAYFVAKGLKTKLLLGDNSDATTYEFIYPALNDPSTHQYIGAVSFHSWRGWETETLKKWADAATKIKLPLLVGEGSIDAQAHGYPAIFAEQTYALEEINLYTRILAICQPASILQWQLTADYSPLAGGGIFGDTGLLRPLQRFWNLKQLASTPKGLYAMPLSVSSSNVSGAALGDNAKGTYAIHLVNNGATRQVTLKGLPTKIKSLRIIVTDKQRPMQEGKAIPVINGQAKFQLDATSYTTLISKN